MANYLIKSSLCLLALLVFYHLFLEKEKMHKFNRFYLLGSVLFSFCAPLFVIYVEATQVPVEIVQSIPLQENFTIVENQPTPIIEEKFDYTQLLYGFYGLVTLFLFARFLKNIINIFLRIKRNTKLKINNATIVLLNETVIPHTFWNYVFINKKEYENESFNKELLTHELTHVAQYHTVDILCVEILKIVFWFNPLLYILKRLLQLNHEFLADEKVIETHKNIGNYQSLLLEKSLHATSYQLTSNLNYLVTKKRLTMMTKRTHKYSWLKQLAIAPLLVGLFFVFAERVEAQDKKQVKDEPIETIIEQKKNISKEDLKKYKLLVSKAKNSEIIKEKDLVWMMGTYQGMSENQRKTVDNIFHYAMPINLTWSKRKVKKEQIENWKNNEKYAIWIDGKTQDNSVLKKYKPSDFSYYSESFVHKNARSKKFPQDYQVSIYTNEHFKKLVKENSQIGKAIKLEKGQKNEKTKKKNSPSSNGSKQTIIEKPISTVYLTEKEIKERSKDKIKENEVSSIEIVKDTIPKNNRSKEKSEKEAEYVYIIQEVVEETNKVSSENLVKVLEENKNGGIKLEEVNDINKELKDENTSYYINWKKVSKKEVLDLESNQIKSMNVGSSSGKKIVNIITKPIEIIEVVDSKQKTKEKKNELAEFKINIYKEDNKVFLTCAKGCAWKELSFTLKQDAVQLIDNLGMTNTIDKKRDFVFNLSYNHKDVFSLNSHKGTAWVTLGFSNSKMNNIHERGVN